MPTETFLEVARALLEDPEAKAAFGADPDAYLAARGFDGLTAEDVADAVGFVTEAMPPGVAAHVGAVDAEDPLGLLAQLEPVAIDEAGSDQAGIDDLGSSGQGEDDMTEDQPLDQPLERGDDDALAPVDATVPDPGFGVGYSNDDLDDLSPPEVHEGELPVGFDLQVDEAGFLEPDHQNETEPADHPLDHHVDHPVDHVVDHHDPAADHDDDAGHLDLDL